MIGWAIGGLVFGILGDRIGRAKTMMLTILLYSVFTGLSALSTGFWDFAFYRFLTGLGVGGEFAVGVSLVAEVMPDRARPMALGWLQALSAVGNMMAAVHQHRRWASRGDGRDRQRLAGDVPRRRAARAALALHLRAQGARAVEGGRRQAQGRQGRGALGPHDRLGSLERALRRPRWRRNTIVGMLLAFAGVVGLWGIGFFSFDLIRTRLQCPLHAIWPGARAQRCRPEEVRRGNLTFWTGITSLLQNAGAFFGIYAFSRITDVHRPQAGVRHLVRAGDGRDRVHVLVPRLRSTRSSG